jgi:IS5 family transposase
MAEIGLVTFAQQALSVSKAVMPTYRSRFSKHIFTQPQLLAILSLMRYEDWTYREAEVRLSEHQELRKALELKQVPDYTTLYRFLRRLDEDTIHRALAETVRQIKADDAAVTLAVDATGLAPGSISTFFVKRRKDRGEGLPWRYWLKWVVSVDISDQILISQMAKRGPHNDCAELRPLTSQAATLVSLECVLADAEFDSERNHRHVRQALQARSIIPAKRGKPNWKLKGTRAEMKANFPSDEYRFRNLVETVFSVVKRKLSAKAPGRSLQTQQLQALLLGLAYNIYKLRPFRSWPFIPFARISTEPKYLKVNG